MLDQVQCEKQDATTLALHTALEKARCALDLSVETWTHYMDITPREYVRILERKSDLSVPALKNIADKLQLNISDLAKGYVDTESLVQQQLGNKSFLHPRYKVAATSRKFTAINALDFITKVRGPHMRTLVNRHFQIHNDFWREGFNDHINIRFLLELFDFLSKNGLQSHHFRAIGWHMHLTLRNTEFERQLSQMPSLADVYEFAFTELIGALEKNALYEIHTVNAETCIIKSVPNPSVMEALKNDHLATAAGCQSRAGVIAAFAMFLSKQPPLVRKTHCILQGDHACQFVVDYSHLGDPEPSLLA